MNRINRYLFLEAFAPFAAAVFAFLVLFIGTEAMTEASKLIARYELPWQKVMLLLVLRIPWGIAWTLPMATGMAVILAIGRICHDYEYTAIIVGGASFRRVMVPFLVFAGMVTVFALYVQEYLGPATQMEYMQRSNDLVMAARADLIDFQVRLSKMDAPQRMMLAAERLDTIDKIMYTVSLTITRDGEEIYHATAKQATWDADRQSWILYDARVFSPEQGYSVAMNDVTVQQLANDAGYGGEIVFKYTPDEVKVYATGKPDYLPAPLIRKRLKWMIESKFERKEINRVLIYIHRRWALATSCFIFVLVGAPLAVRPQRGASKGSAFAIALLLILVYYITWQTTSLLGEASAYPLLWAWCTNLCGLVLGVFLWRRVPD